MAEPIKISSSKYTKSGKVSIDGNIWDAVLPGAGTEMRFSQASRACKLAEARLTLLGKKIDNGTVTEEELDKYEEYSKSYETNERIIYDIFMQVFRDGTKDNKQVKQWMEETPTAIMMRVFEDVKAPEESVNGQDKSEEPDTQPAG